MSSSLFRLGSAYRQVLLVPEGKAGLVPIRLLNMKAGKTTTSALLALGLLVAGLIPIPSVPCGSFGNGK